MVRNYRHCTFFNKHVRMLTKYNFGFSSPFSARKPHATPGKEALVKPEKKTLRKPSTAPPCAHAESAGGFCCFERRKP